MTKPRSKEGFPAANSLLFVYGTLQQGGQYHYFLERCEARFVSPGTLTTPYPLILADYPCLLDQPGKGFPVTGEIYEIKKPGDWESIDHLEGYPSEYTRRLESVKTDSQTLLAWTYFYQWPDLLDPALKPVPTFRP
ncbi:gamma-glutamylcyclotransferase [Puniceicoccales bacterium CK1056]|uniref:Gamma-glutamylcyclotransferase family protein n=1 Tax=Oceanipulchritudo coccoides TaxID=2706888 RepID=A0A6B2M3F0_9BACT|nr:gamma-glutamylcyclotransferase family protein [Oceanipulchritudo coccoides]NDV63531.1 gamma-glutamylcyclotransferase [Oceanipulchritudo coccoides]